MLLTKLQELQKTLKEAVIQGNWRTVHNAIKQGYDLNSADRHDWTLVLWAAHAGQIEVIELLANNGADLSKANSSYSSPLSIATRNGDLNTVQKLLDYGANVNPEPQDGPALPISVKYEYDDIFYLLIERGADVNLASIDGQTALMLATYMHRAEIVRCLLDQGARSDIEDKEGRTAIDFAESRFREEKEIFGILVSLLS